MEVAASTAADSLGVLRTAPCSGTCSAERPHSHAYGAAAAAATVEAICAAQVAAASAATAASAAQSAAAAAVTAARALQDYIAQAQPIDPSLAARVTETTGCDAAVDVCYGITPKGSAPGISTKQDADCSTPATQQPELPPHQQQPQQQLAPPPPPQPELQALPQQTSSQSPSPRHSESSQPQLEGSQQLPMPHLPTERRLRQLQQLQQQQQEQLKRAMFVVLLSSGCKQAALERDNATFKTQLVVTHCRLTEEKEKNASTVTQLEQYASSYQSWMAQATALQTQLDQHVAMLNSERIAAHGWVAKAESLQHKLDAKDVERDRVKRQLATMTEERDDLKKRLAAKSKQLAALEREKEKEACHITSESSSTDASQSEQQLQDVLRDKEAQLAQQQKQFDHLIASMTTEAAHKAALQQEVNTLKAELQAAYELELERQQALLSKTKEEWADHASLLEAARDVPGIVLGIQLESTLLRRQRAIDLEAKEKDALAAVRQLRSQAALYEESKNRIMDRLISVAGPKATGDRAVAEQQLQCMKDVLQGMKEDIANGKLASASSWTLTQMQVDHDLLARELELLARKEGGTFQHESVTDSVVEYCQAYHEQAWMAKVESLQSQLDSAVKARDTEIAAAEYWMTQADKLEQILDGMTAERDQFKRLAMEANGGKIPLLAVLKVTDEQLRAFKGLLSEPASSDVSWKAEKSELGEGVPTQWQGQRSVAVPVTGEQIAAFNGNISQPVSSDASWEVEKSELEKQLAALKEQLEAKNRELAQQKQQFRAASKVQQEEIMRLKKVDECLSQQLDWQLSESSVRRELEETKAELARHKDPSTNAKAALEQEVQQLKKDVELLTKQLQIAKNCLAYEKENRAKDEARWAESALNCSKCPAWAAHTEDLQQSLDSKEAEVDRYKRQATAISADRENLKKQLAASNAEMVALKRQLANKSNGTQAAPMSESAKDKEIRRIKAELSQAVQRQQQLEEELQEKDSEICTLETDKAALMQKQQRLLLELESHKADLSLPPPWP